MYSRTELIGFVQSNPRLKVLQSNGATKCEFTVSTVHHFITASKEKKKHEELHTVQAWGPKAEMLEERVRRGMRIAIHGCNRTEKWTDDHDGKPRQRTIVVVDEFNLLDPLQEDQD